MRRVWSQGGRTAEISNELGITNQKGVRNHRQQDAMKLFKLEDIPQINLTKNPTSLTSYKFYNLLCNATGY